MSSLTQGRRYFTRHIVGLTVFELVSATTNGTGDEIILTFSQSLGGVAPPAGAFTLSGSPTIGSISISGNQLILTGVSPAYELWEMITIGYTQPGTNNLQSVGGTVLPSFTGQNLTNAVTGPGVTFAELTAVNDVVYTLIGQSNAGVRGGNSVGIALQAWASANIPAPISLLNVAQGGTGFISGFGPWAPTGAQGSAFISGMQPLKAGSGSDTYYGPVVIIQGEADAASSATPKDAASWGEQVANLKQAFENTVGIDLPWIVVRLNAASSTNYANVVQDEQDAFINTNPDVFLVDIDHIPLLADGLHYAPADYSLIEAEIRAVIDANRLLLPATYVERTPTPYITGGGVVFDSTFTGTPGADSSTAVHTVGSFSMVLGATVIKPSGSGLTVTGARPAEPNWMGFVDQTPVGTVTRVTAQFTHRLSSNNVGLVIKYDAAREDEHISIMIRKSSTNTLRLFRYKGGGTLGSQSFTPPADELFDMVVEYSIDEVRVQVNANPVLTVSPAAFNPPEKAVGVRLLEPGDLNSLRVEGLTNFTI